MAMVLLSIGGVWGLEPRMNQNGLVLDGWQPKNVPISRRHNLHISRRLIYRNIMETNILVPSSKHGIWAMVIHPIQGIIVINKRIKPY